ncbi:MULTISPECIES: hypothetical protein [Chryseobacterium]|uniref:hypothetical protein n=1 Tax=Chryseobacterium TaxID=59732 RepID=UPI000C9E0064|nr:MULTISPECIES: hypothetical protein [Chryseobacterium]VXC15011.1 hypothetical protein CHRYSEO8AT_50002 [Chryseobacterium sp. 8AT]
MKQYDETEFTLITHGDMENYQWLIKDNIKRNRRNGIVFNIVIYTFVSVIALTFIFMVTKDIFFENYPLHLFNQEKKINKINQQIKVGDDYKYLETPAISDKVKELELRVDDLESN